jgi:hypothetical protein
VTQNTWTTLNPNTHGGTFLADQLNDWVAAVVSNHRGSSRPAYAVAGMIWPKTVSSTVEELYYFDGTDVFVGTNVISASIRAEQIAPPRPDGAVNGMIAQVRGSSEGVVAAKA